MGFTPARAVHGTISGVMSLMSSAAVAMTVVRLAAEQDAARRAVAPAGDSLFTITLSR